MLIGPNYFKKQYYAMHWYNTWMSVKGGQIHLYSLTHELGEIFAQDKPSKWKTVFTYCSDCDLKRGKTLNGYFFLILEVMIISECVSMAH